MQYYTSSWDLKDIRENTKFRKIVSILQIRCFAIDIIHHQLYFVKCLKTYKQSRTKHSILWVKNAHKTVEIDCSNLAAQNEMSNHLVLNLRENYKIDCFSAKILTVKVMKFIVLVFKFYNKNNEIDYFSAQVWQ